MPSMRNIDKNLYLLWVFLVIHSCNFTIKENIGNIQSHAKNGQNIKYKVLLWLILSIIDVCRALILCELTRHAYNNPHLSWN